MASDIYHDRLEIPIGSTFEKAWPITDSDTGLGFDLTDCTALCEVADQYAGTVVTKFHTADVSWPGLITLTDVADGANAILSMDSTTTGALPVFSNYVFDLYVIDSDGQPWRVVQGKAFATPGVSGV